ncbi:IcmP (DotM) (plasmid) [Pseudomonas sp. FeN3W]|nr:IcmP (DotM) [Pseudomonas sp. FeN3W]
MAQPKGGGGADNNMEMWVFLIVVIFILVFWAFSELFWIYATGWRWLRIAELGIASYAVPDFIQRFTGWDFNGGLAFLLEAEPEDLNAKIIGGFDNIYLRFFNWLPGLVIAASGAKIFMSADNVSIKYNMETLMLKMSNAFPGNKSFLNVHPEETPLDFYPDDPSSYEYSMAMTERQFGQCIPPLGLMKEAEKDKSLKRPIWDGAKKFDNELCRKSFEKQVGGLYRGYNKLDDDEKKLFDLFRNKILIRRNEVMPILTNYMKQILIDRLNKKVFGKDPKANKAVKINELGKPSVKYLADFPSHKMLVEKLTQFVDQKLVEQGSAYRIKEIDVRKMASSSDLKSVLRHVMADDRMSRHAFTATGLMTLLEAAREGSTLPPSSFRWLKGRNRTLWYALNCVGKKVAFTESAGTFAHWLLEKEAKMAVPHAEVTEAIEALRMALGLSSKLASKDQDDMWG